MRPTLIKHLQFRFGNGAMIIIALNNDAFHAYISGFIGDMAEKLLCEIG